MLGRAIGKAPPVVGILPVVGTSAGTGKTAGRRPVADTPPTRAGTRPPEAGMPRVVGKTAEPQSVAGKRRPPPLVPAFAGLPAGLSQVFPPVFESAVGLCTGHTLLG